MQSSVLPEPIWVASPQALQRMQADLARQERLALDTESNSLYAYREQVCLLQFSTPRRDYLVDTLAGLDLRPLGAILANPQIEKVLHAAEYDLICLRRDFGWQVHNLFDSMQAARVLGWKKLGLSSILQEQFGVQVEKRYQKANWGKRPLPREMRAYARLDTRYLLPLRDLLYKELVRSQRLDLAAEDFVWLTDSQESPNGKPLYAAVKGYHNLDPQHLAVLQALCEWREERAQQLDRPPFKVIGSSALQAVTQALPSSVQELEKVQGLPAKLRQRYQDELLAAVQRGLSAEPIHNDHKPRPSQAYILRLERLFDWRKQAARKMGVESDVVIPRTALEQVAKENPSTPQALQQTLQDLPVRYARFAAQLLTVINKE